ncbi:hypothetical protein H0H92_012238, partial [Tricholoma furcatifolium]
MPPRKEGIDSGNIVAEPRKHRLASNVFNEDNVAEPQYNNTENEGDSLNADTNKSKVSQAHPNNSDDEVLKDFVAKKKGERRNKNVGSEDDAEQELGASVETFQQDLSLMRPSSFNKNVELTNLWILRSYSNYRGRCHQKIRRYLDSNDKGSTSNLHKHAEKCWGEEAFMHANNADNIAKVRDVVERLKKNPNGDIKKMFSGLEAKGIISYSHRQHTAEQT